MDKVVSKIIYCSIMKAVIYIMGVAGSGKTTIAKLLSAETAIPFFDADDFHPAVNILKMKAGRPLNDEDRQPWLAVLNKLAAEQAQLKGAIIACSALKDKYRLLLQSGIAECKWIFLQGSYGVIYERMNNRNHQYMTEQLLQSQFESLEIPASALVIDINNEPAKIVEIIRQHLSEKIATRS